MDKANCKYCKGSGEVDISFGSSPKIVKCLDCEDINTVHNYSSGQDSLAAKYIHRVIYTYKNPNDFESSALKNKAPRYEVEVNLRICDNDGECVDAYWDKMVFKDDSIIVWVGVTWIVGARPAEPLF